MVKKSVIVFCLLMILHTAFAPSLTGPNDKVVDSLDALLTHTTKPADRFDLLNKVIDHNDGLQGNFQDPKLGIEMHRIAQQLNNDSLLAISNNVIGNYFRRNGDFATALGYLFKDIPLAEKVKDKRRISSLYFDIAEIYFYLQNFETCLKYAKIGGSNLPDRSSPMYDFMALQFYRTMGEYFLQKKQADSALVYIHKIEETNRRLKKPNYIMYQLTLSGTAYWQLGDNDMAKVYFSKADALTDSVKSPLILYIKDKSYIPYLLGNKQFKAARQYAIQLLQTGRTVNSSNLKLMAVGFLSTAYHNLQMPDSAYYYLSMQSALKDSVLSEANISKIQSLAFNEEIRKIDEHAKQKKDGEQRRQNIQYALIALGIIMFIIVFLLLSRTVIVNEKIISFFAVLGLLVVFEFVNLLIHPWLANFTNESPIWMLLVLVLIAALLIPLHHRLEHWIKRKMVEKNKAIRLAAAKKTIEELEKKDTKNP